MSRKRLLVAIALVVPAGFATKLFDAAWIRGHAGGVFYVVFFILATLALFPRARPTRVAAGVFLATCGIESQRELAAELVVAPLTVKKAYDELERRGYLRTERGRGTFVCDAPPSLSDDERAARLRAMARRLAAEAEVAGMSVRRLMDLVREERARLREERDGRS